MGDYAPNQGPIANTKGYGIHVDPCPKEETPMTCHQEIPSEIPSTPKTEPLATLPPSQRDTIIQDPPEGWDEWEDTTEVRPPVFD